MTIRPLAVLQGRRVRYQSSVVFIMTRRIILVLLIVISAAVAIWLSIRRESQLISLTFETGSIMGTRTALRVVVPAGESAQGQAALEAATTELRRIETVLSVYRADSEISLFNAGPAHVILPLSPDTLSLLKLARDISTKSIGAFDPTCRPLLQLWRTCEHENRLPTASEVAEARARVGWQWVKFHPNGVEKLKEGIELDLGGIGKGYAVDRAARAMRKAAVSGGMLECGGEIVVFGRAEHQGPWQIALRDPFSPLSTETLGAMVLLQEGAVSTSGNYERYYEIQGRRFSHIVDPRTGLTVDSVPQVTVIGDSSTATDGWSTALTVLGRDGLRLLPPGMDAMLVAGSSSDNRIFKTPGFDRLTRRPERGGNRRAGWRVELRFPRTESTAPRLPAVF